MAYSERALAFARLPTDAQVRISDRVSYLYLEYTRVLQDETGVVAVYEREDGTEIVRRIQIPVGSIAVVMLGPGTSVTQPAMTSMARSGASVIFTGGGGVPTYAAAVPLTSSARWTQAQARLWSNETARVTAARTLYQKQLPGTPLPDGVTIAMLRGVEGQVMRDTYRQYARRYKIKNFRKNTDSDDPVNVALNMANGILYGCAGSACAALGVHPALGVIHQGSAQAFLFDLADTYKPSISIPAAFQASQSSDPSAEVRRLMRRDIHGKKVMAGMVKTITEILAPHLGADDGPYGTLISDDGTRVPGHANYAPEQ